MDWLFQCNPKRYDVAALLERGDTRDDWAMNQGRKFVSPGDRVFFWQTGKNAQLLAVGRVTSPVYERSDNEFGRYFVDVVFQHCILPPLTRKEALSNETLRNLTPFKGIQGTNYALRDPAIVAELEKTIEGRLVPIPASEELEA
jgi:EVE domain